ncbi:MAG: hypothetical protein Q8K36_00870, partial [Alphaproteobacteria bacterium]|nr:hypothetical protein [Alphaproteobacteria bacterium]
MRRKAFGKSYNESMERCHYLWMLACINALPLTENIYITIINYYLQSEERLELWLQNFYGLSLRLYRKANERFGTGIGPSMQSCLLESLKVSLDSKDVHDARLLQIFDEKPKRKSCVGDEHIDLSCVCS